MHGLVQPISWQQSHFRIVRISVYDATIGPKFDYEGAKVEQSIAVNRVSISIHLLLGPLKWIASWPWPVMLLLLRDYATFDYAK